MAVEFKLPDRLDSTAASSLPQDLMAYRGQDIILDASGVMVIGALAFEVLLSAARQWELDSRDYRLCNPSERFVSTALILGLETGAPWLLQAEKVA